MTRGAKDRGRIGRRLAAAGVVRLARRLPLRLLVRLARAPLVVVRHAVSDRSLPHVRHLLAVPATDAFEAELAYLRSRWMPIGYECLHAHQLGRIRLPSHAVHLTFDDGYVQCFDVVRPLLLRWEVPCSFFITTDFVHNRAAFHRNIVSLCVERLADRDLVARLRSNGGLDRSWEVPRDLENRLRRIGPEDREELDEVCRILGVDWRSWLAAERPYLTTDQIRQLVDDGFTIGAHGLTHRHLGRLADEEHVEREIAESCRMIQAWTGQRLVPFAMPHSGTGLDRDRLAGIRARHPHVGLLFDTGGLRRDVPFLVNRVSADSLADARRRAAAGRANGSRRGEPVPLCRAIRHAAIDATLHQLGLAGRGVR